MAAVEPCILVEAAYASDAESRRAPYRDAHLDRLEKLDAEGALLFGGGDEDLTKSILIFAVASEESVRAIIDTDIYLKNGVWTSYTVTKVNRVIFHG